MIRMQTNHGVIKLQLDSERVPETVANFLRYVEDGFYNGTIFHRVIGNFMIQGGGFEPGMRQKRTLPPVRNEAAKGQRNRDGTIAMARTSDPHSATSQFFINVKDNAFLDHPGRDGWGYCVFGRVVEGREVVETIKAVPTGDRSGHRDVPLRDVIIEHVDVVDE